MDFQTNKKNNNPIHSFKRCKLPIISKAKKQWQRTKFKGESPQNIDRRMATLDSLDLGKIMCCEGIKLNTRSNRSVEKRLQKRLQHGEKTEVGFQKFGFSNQIKKNNFLSRYSKLFQNPEEHKNEGRSESIIQKGFSLLPNISQENVLIGKQNKEELYVFYLPEKCYMWLYPVALPISYSILHPNLAEPIGVLHRSKPQQSTYYLVRQYGCQTLRSLVGEFGKIGNKKVRQYLRQIVQAVSFMHCNKLSHNRLNMEAILHDGENRIVVNNFKSSLLPLSKQERQKYKHYFPPQFLLSRNYSESNKNDVWAIGCIAIQLLSSRRLKSSALHPYNRSPTSFSEDSREMLQKIAEIGDCESAHSVKSGNNSQMQSQARQISVLGLEFIALCLSISMDRRATLLELIQHPYLTN